MGLHLTETATTWHAIVLFFFLMKNWVLDFSLAEFPGAGYFSFITNLAHFNLIPSPWYMSLSLQDKFIWVQFSHLKLIGCLPHYPDWSVDCLLFIFLITKKINLQRKDQRRHCVLHCERWCSYWEAHLPPFIYFWVALFYLNVIAFWTSEVLTESLNTLIHSRFHWDHCRFRPEVLRIFS